MLQNELRTLDHILTPAPSGCCPTLCPETERSKDSAECGSSRILRCLFKIVDFDSVEEAQAHDGPFMERLVFYMVDFSGHIERDGLKLCQEWVRNTVDPDLVETPYNKDKLLVDIDSMKGMIKKGMERGELKKDTPADTLANALIDVIYGEMLCWDMSGGAYSFEERTKEFCSLFLPAMMQPYISDSNY